MPCVCDDGDDDDENGIADAKIHTRRHKTAIMVGSIKCHIDYWPATIYEVADTGEAWKLSDILKVSGSETIETNLSLKMANKAINQSIKLNESEH